jgi:hypothetical protein
MDPHVRRAALRFVESLNRSVEAESFSEEDAWGLMQDLVYEFALPGWSLNAAQVAALRDFGNTAGIKPGAPLSAYRPGLEAALGPSQLSDEDLEALVRWAHGQVNAAFEQAPGGTKLQLDGAPRGTVPPSRKPVW